MRKLRSTLAKLEKKASRKARSARLNIKIASIEANIKLLREASKVLSSPACTEEEAWAVLEKLKASSDDLRVQVERYLWLYSEIERDATDK